MTSGEQVKTWPCSAEHVMRHPNFALGLADIRAGRPFADQIEDNLWAYERGRQFGAIAVAKGYDRLVAAIHQDLGGADRLSAMELELVEAFAGASKLFGSINTDLLTGAAITPALVNMYALSISAMVRTSAKLGTARRAKPVPSLNEWLARKAREEGKTPEGEIIE